MLVSLVHGGGRELHKRSEHDQDAYTLASAVFSFAAVRTILEHVLVPQYLRW